MRKGILSVAALALVTTAGIAVAQQAPRPYYVGNEGVGLPVAPAAPTADNPNPPNNFAAASDNVKMYGALYSVESCVYDATRGVIVAPNRGVGQAVRANDAWIALINSDGSVHTPRWIGIQNPGAQRDNMDPPLVLNEPFGSFIHNGILYLADRDGGTPNTEPGATGNTPSVGVIRMFDMATGAPAGEIVTPGTTGLNDITVAADGTIYGTQSGGVVNDQNPNAAETWQVWQINPDGTSSILIQGAPLNRPNGIEMDNDGNIVVVNIGDAAVVTFDREGNVLKTEQAAQPGSDGLVIMPDGTKYVSSVTQGGISMLPADGSPATLIATNIPSAASMCYDSGANQLVVPMNANNGLAFVQLP